MRLNTTINISYFKVILNFGNFLIRPLIKKILKCIICQQYFKKKKKKRWTTSQTYPMPKDGTYSFKMC